MCFSSSSSFFSSYSIHSSFLPHSQPINQPRREELNSLQANVEFLTNRIDTSLARPAVTYNYEPAIDPTSSDPIISSNHSSPQYSNVTFANPAHTVDDSANYAINNTSNLTETPSKILKRGSSIKYVNDADDEPVYYNEPPIVTEQPTFSDPQGKGKSFRKALHHQAF